MVYKPYKLHLSRGQATKAVKGQPIRLRHNQLNTGNIVILLHPMNYKVLNDAFRKKKGAVITLGPGEIEATKSSEMDGTGVFDFFKKAYNWVKGNWSSIKPIVSAIADVAVPAAATALGVPQAGIVARSGLKKLTGVGAMPVNKKVRVQMKGPKGKGLYLSRGSGLYL